MSTISELSDGAEREALLELAAGMGDADVLAVWAALTAGERVRLLQEFDDLDERVPALAAQRERVRAQAREHKRLAVEARAASEGLRFCAQAPEAFAELGSRVRVYCSVRGAVHGRYDVEPRTHWDTDDMESRYRVRLLVKFDEHVVVCFRHTDLWSVHEYDDCNVTFEYDCAKDASRSVRVPAGVPLSAHDWRVAARAYLRVATQYYNVERRGSEWMSTDEDAPAPVVHGRRRTRAPKRPHKRRRAPASSESSFAASS